MIASPGKGVEYKRNKTPAGKGRNHLKLKDLLQDIPVTSITANEEMDISGVSYDSRQTESGDLFVAMRGYQTDGHHFIEAATKAGAVCILCEEPPHNGIPYIQVENARRALAILGGNYFNHPAEQMTMVAVTGTNGKTSTTYLLKAVLEQELDATVGLIGTNQNMVGNEVIPTERTTPESFEVQRLLRKMADKGCTHVVMETSSHALYLDRVYGISFTVGIFTNLTQDHLDFHKTMEAYCDAKAILFRRCHTGVINYDDPWTKRLMHEATCDKITYGLQKNSDLWAEELDLTADGISFIAKTKELSVPISVGIPGKFMVYNTLGVLGAAMTLGIPLAKSAEVLKAVPHVKGRVEVVPTPGTDYTVLIDYAHSPDGLQNVLSSVKGFAKGRTVAVFGCGGDRDRTKRPKMGKIAAELADFVVVTSDNPRTEEPGAIIQEILPGLDGMNTRYQVVEDRVAAIRWAMEHAQKDDVIVLCGKGHETYQIVGTEKRHLDEREVVAQVLADQN